MTTHFPPPPRRGPKTKQSDITFAQTLRDNHNAWVQYPGPIPPRRKDGRGTQSKRAASLRRAINQGHAPYNDGKYTAVVRNHTEIWATYTGP